MRIRAKEGSGRRKEPMKRNMPHRELLGSRASYWLRSFGFSAAEKGHGGGPGVLVGRRISSGPRVHWGALLQVRWTGADGTRAVCFGRGDGTGVSWDGLLFAWLDGLVMFFRFVMVAQRRADL